MNVKLVNIPVAVNWCRNYNEVSLTWEMPCLSYMKFLTCQQIWGYVELHILAKLRCGVHTLNIVEGTPWSGVLQVMKNPDEPLVNSSTIFVAYFYHIITIFVRYLYNIQIICAQYLHNFCKKNFSNKTMFVQYLHNIFTIFE